jgi:hypothetical protein
MRTAILLIPLLATLPVLAQDERPRWYGVDHGAQQARLVYGVPDGGMTLLNFICDKHVPEVSAYITHPPVRLAAGTSVPVRLSDGTATLAFSATVAPPEADGLLRLRGQVPLDAAFEAILASDDRMSVSVAGSSARYPLDGVAAAAKPLIALCGTAVRVAPAADLKVTVTNKSRRRLEQLALREPDSIESDSDTFGYDGLTPGRTRTFTIPGGAGVCTYEISVLFEEKEEDCCSDPMPIGQQDLCGDPRIIVHD